MAGFAEQSVSPRTPRRAGAAPAAAEPRRAVRGRRSASAPTRPRWSPEGYGPPPPTRWGRGSGARCEAPCPRGAGAGPAGRRCRARRRRARRMRRSPTCSLEHPLDRVAVEARGELDVGDGRTLVGAVHERRRLEQRELALRAEAVDGRRVERLAEPVTVAE